MPNHLLHRVVGIFAVVHDAKGNFPFILIRSYNFSSNEQTDTPPLNSFRTLLSADNKLCKESHLVCN
jgi:hypothetical protein